MNIQNFDYIILGAGTSGLAMSALLAKKKTTFKTLEAHYYLGGSSSYFIRNHYSFDVGATTISGINNEGPLARFLKKTDIELPLKKINPGLISLINEKTIHRFSNIDQYASELNYHFPQVSIELYLNLLEDLARIEKKVYALITQNNLPILNLSDALQLFSLKNLSGIGLIPELRKSTQKYLETFFPLDDQLIKYFNEILFVTAQNKMNNVPGLLGAMGLNYPSDTYYCMGGMKTFCDKISELSNSYISKNQKVVKIKKNKNGYLITTNNGDRFYTPKLISTLPFWNHTELCDDLHLKDFFSKNSTMNQAINNCWSAFTLYFTIPLQLNLESLYYQVHGKMHEKIESESYFVSFSHPEDIHRNIDERQTVTISTHCKFEIFHNLSLEEQRELKNEISNKILETFCSKFKIEINDILHLESGTPKTFERFTNRYHGLVGGIGFDLKNSPLKTIYSPLPDENFYLIGDTSFMGQGVATVIAGALSLNEKISL